MVRSLVRAVIAAAAVFSLASCSETNNNVSGGGGGGKELDSGRIVEHGGTHTHTFNSVGTFNYYCTLHPDCTGLQGTVTVVAASDTIAVNHIRDITQTEGGTCYILSAPTTTVHVGESVTWTNNSGADHNVTSR